MRTILAGLLTTFVSSCAPLQIATPRVGKTIIPPVADALTSTSKAPMEILLVDGIWGTHLDLVLLRNHLNKEVAPARIWRYDNSGLTSLEKVAAQLAAELKALDRPFCLVGFSMGGLVIREALRQAPSLPLQKAVMMHSPHSGSLAAHLFPLAACREMRPGSEFLRRLDAAEWSYPTLVTWSSGDLMVVPGESARWSKATHIIRSSVPAHIWPLISPDLHRSISEFLKY